MSNQNPMRAGYVYMRDSGRSMTLLLPMERPRIIYATGPDSIDFFEAYLNEENGLVVRTGRPMTIKPGVSNQIVIEEKDL